MYLAALFCEGCGLEKRRLLDAAGLRPDDPDDETTYDSDDYPKGPYPDGGGEADCPQHCAACGEHLENPLTTDGQAYVREAVAEGLKEGGKGVAATTWRAFYGIEGSDES